MESVGRLTATEPRPGLGLAIRRGLAGRCPRCGSPNLFGRFLKVMPECGACGLELHHHRADDLPPYLVIVIVGHLIGTGVMFTELELDLPLWVSATVWPLLTIALCLLLIQPIKGAVVGLQYALGMHGFGVPVPGRPSGDR